MGLWDNINQFIANGQDRRAWLDDKVSGVVDYYTPPHLRQATRFAAEMNPIQGMSDSMSQFGVAANPSVTMDERRRAAVNSLAEGLLAVAPAALAARGYMTPVQAATEGLLGWSPAGQQIGDDLGRFWVDEAGNISWNKLPMYHGTPDVREVADAGGFVPRTKGVSRISDPDKWDDVQSLLGDITPGTSAYMRKLDEAGELIERVDMQSPVFFSPDYRMAESYADDTMALDYQNAVPEVLRAETSPQNILDVSAMGQNFSGIDKEAVRLALERSGLGASEVDAQIRRYTHGRSSSKISTDDLAVIANDFGFDAVDVSNVKDDYFGGGPAGRVRMMLNMDQISVPKYAPQLTDAEAMARDILDLRAAGRASEVTDDMMAKADPQYMFNNTPLPMDEASRVARAGEAGFDAGTPLYHGTTARTDYSSINPSQRGKIGPGVYLTPEPNRASVFAGADSTSVMLREPALPNSRVMPLVATNSPADEAARWEARSARGDYDGDNLQAYRDVFDPLGFDGVSVADERTILNPQNIRSRFARFDPEFSHLANLSAGIGGLGLLGYVGNQSSDPLQTPRAE